MRAIGADAGEDGMRHERWHAVRGALSALRTALALCKAGQARRTAQRVRLALSSCEGAERHARLQAQKVTGPDLAPVDYVSYARARYHHDGELEIDDNAIISTAEEGAYVQAWAWVYTADVKAHKTETP